MVSDRLERADAIGALGLLLVVAPIVLWGRDRGLSGLLDVEQGWRNVGLLTGLLASIFMVMQVLLIARIPWIERSWGHDVLAHRHRWLGFWSFWLMISHIVAFTVEHATRFKMPSLLDSLVDTFFLRPWMVWASLGASLVVVVVVTSIRYARAKMRYESWHLLHLYAYAGMGFALPHQIFKGPDFRGPAAQVYWWSVYALAVSAIVVFRLITPIYRTIYHRLRVTAVTEERPDVVSITMTGRHLDRLKPRAGQFFIWRFLDGPGWMRGHPFSLSDTPSNDRLRVTIQACGDGSSRAARLRVGALVAIEGPFGTMTLDRRRHQQVVFVAAGVGIAPLRALIGETHFTAGEATLLYPLLGPGARNLPRRGRTSRRDERARDRLSARRAAQRWVVATGRSARRRSRGPSRSDPRHRADRHLRLRAAGVAQGRDAGRPARRCGSPPHSQ